MRTIRKATTDDLEHIRSWLQQENDHGDDLFIGNFPMIEKGQMNGTLITLADNDLPVAFALGDRSIDIFAVKPDRRGCGIGKELASHWIYEARERDVIGFDGECSPKSSLGFWKKMGCTQVKSTNWHPRFIMPLGKSREVPADRKQVKLKFELFDSIGNAIPGWDEIDAAIVETWDYMLARDFVAYVPECDALLIVLAEEPAIHKEVRVCKIEDIGGDRNGSWIRVRNLVIEK